MPRLTPEQRGETPLATPSAHPKLSLPQNRASRSETPSEADEIALQVARNLIAAGVPVFRSKPDLARGIWNPLGGTGGTGYWIPKQWENTVADPAVLDQWRPGDALCAVMGHTLDALDVDPRHDGDQTAAEWKAAGDWPEVYGQQQTPSGGTHDLVARLGIPKTKSGGIDVQAGAPDGHGKGFIFLAPTVRISKATGELGTYVWTDLPDPQRMQQAGADKSGARLVARLGNGSTKGTTTPRRTQRKPSLSELLSNPPSRGGGETNDWLTRVAGHYVNKHRADYDAYIDACRAAIALVDPNYESFDATVEFRWANEQRKPKVVALDDASLVDAVADAFRSRWCWSGGHGWREWDGKIWASRTEPALVERVRTHMQEMYWKLSAANSDAGYAKQLGSLLNGGRVRGVAGFLKGALEVDSLAFDNRPNLLNCRNGVVDLRTGDISAHDPALLLTKITATDCLPGATHPDWDKALESVREGDRRWLQVRVGQALTGYRVTDELMPVLYGGGRNGKTTFLSSVQSAFGTHARAVSDRVLTARDSDHPTELTDLQGLRLAVIEELPEAVPLSVKRLKDTVGQPTITARKIAKDTVTWETTHALFLATNHKPRVNETDHGTWRRLALVRFPFVFDGKDGIGHLPGDPGLHDRMRRGDEGRAEAVLAWCVTGAMRWFKANRVFLPLPDQIVADTEEWRGESDVVVSYIADRLRFDAHAAIGTTDLLADLNSWLEARGKASWGDQLMTERFGTHERVTVHGVEKRKGRLASSGTRVYGRDGRELPRQPEQARLWWGVAFQAIDGAIGEVPW